MLPARSGWTGRLCIGCELRGFSSGRKLRRHQRVRRLIERQGINMTAHVTVTVWGKPHVVTVYQKSKSEWIVAGQYKDKQIQVTDSGYNAAIKRWREAATDRGK